MIDPLWLVRRVSLVKKRLEGNISALLPVCPGCLSYRRLQQNISIWIIPKQLDTVAKRLKAIVEYFFIMVMKLIWLFEMGNAQCLKSPMLLFSSLSVQCILMCLKKLQKQMKTFFINSCKKTSWCFLWTLIDRATSQSHALLVVSGIYIDISGNCKSSVLWRSVCTKPVNNSHVLWIWDFVCVVSVFMLHPHYMLLYTGEILFSASRTMKWEGLVWLTDSLN